MKDLIPEILKKRIARKQCVAFIGAGFSMACGMPDWKQLLEKLVSDARLGQYDGSSKEALNTCEEAIKDKNYTFAADILKEIMMDGDLDESIRKQFGIEKYHSASNVPKQQMNKRMKGLSQTPFSGIVTTNYDDLIEYALERWCDSDVVKCSSSDPQLGTILSSFRYSKMFLVKLHGSISGNKVVLGTDEYDRTYINTPQVVSFLTALMLRYHLIFIGCSLEDEIIRLRRKLTYDFKGLIPTAYALFRESEYSLKRKPWLRKYAQIECILYRKNDKKHSSVDNFLDNASKFKDPRISQKSESVTLNGIISLDINERLNKIGEINKAIIKYIFDQPHSQIGHYDLLNIEYYDNQSKATILYDISPDERVYRTLFLVSSGFVKEKKDYKDGSTIYSLSPETIDFFKKT
jgi:hypothetical protein